MEPDVFVTEDSDFWEEFVLFGLAVVLPDEPVTVLLLGTTNVVSLVTQEISSLDAPSNALSDAYEMLLPKVIIIVK